MGTNAEIFHFLDDTTLQHIHVSYDGYLSGVGLALFRCYNNPEAIESLFARPGWIVSLEEDPALFDLYETSPKNGDPNYARMTVEEVTKMFQPWEPPVVLGASSSVGRGPFGAAPSEDIAGQAHTGGAQDTMPPQEEEEEEEDSEHALLWGACAYVWRDGTWYIVPSLEEWRAILAGKGRYALTKDLMRQVCTDVTEDELEPGDPALAKASNELLGILVWDAGREAYKLVPEASMEEDAKGIHLVGSQDALARAEALVGAKVAVRYSTIAGSYTGVEDNTVAHVQGIRPFPAV